MNLSHIEHIGIAVKSLDEAIPFWEKQLGLKCYAIEEVKEQKVRTAFFKIGQSKIELLESTDPEGPIGKFIEKKGEGIQHVAIACTGLQLPRVVGIDVREGLAADLDVVRRRQQGEQIATPGGGAPLPVPVIPDCCR